MEAKEFVAAVKTIVEMSKTVRPKTLLAFAVEDGVVVRESGNWVDNTLNCTNYATAAEVVDTACEFLFADVLAESEK
jgi:hypothetical protein